MIKTIISKDEKELAIKKCDGAFLYGIYSRDDFDDILEKIDKNAEFIAYFENDEIIGYAAMYNNDFESGVAYITMIGVCQEYQRRHIGRSLMDQCKKNAKKNGMKTIRLEVLDANEKAIRFYENEGFMFEKRCSINSRYMVFEIFD